MRTKTDNVYVKMGYKDRADYLDDMADSTGVDSYVVDSLAEILGPNEDFDGLVNAMDDYAEMFGYD
jgi:hypothetical protein